MAERGSASPRTGLWGPLEPPAPGTAHRSVGPSGRILLGVCLVAVAGVMLGIAGEVGSATSETLGALMVAALLLAISVPIASGAARRDADPKLVWILVGSAAAKLLGGFFRYSLAYSLNYSDGRTDANGYFLTGIDIADNGFELGGRLIGTRFIELLTGAIYVVVPPSRLAGFFVFAFLSWIGLFFFTRAFRIAFPDGAHRRYDLLVLFMPSMLFWPSSIGKEAWMTLTIGVAVYGVARVLASRRAGFVILGLGLLGTAMVRPHVTLILALAMVVAYPIRRSSTRSTSAPVMKVVGFGVVIVIALVVASQARAFFDVDSLEPESFSAALDEAEARSATGGSEFSTDPVRSIRDVPGAFVTVPFRPYIWEAGDMLQLVAGLEGLVLIVLFITSFRRLLRLPWDMLQRPYLTFAAVYSAGFVIAFSTIGNFGILVRQRVQLYPLLLVLVIPLGDRILPRGTDDGLDPEWHPSPPLTPQPVRIRR